MCGVGRASAQETPDPAAAARFRFGPLRFTPYVKLTDVGVDNNVFNDSRDPKQDSIAVFGPATDAWMHVGPSLLSGKAAVEYLYFDRYENQRAWNSNYHLRWDVPMSRFTPFVEGDYANTKNRTGYEIDSRVRQMSQSATLGTEVKLSGRMRLLMAARRSRLAYDERESPLASDLASSLNRWSNTEHMQLKYRLTSLTSFIVDAEAVQDRFEGDGLRNSNSLIVMPGFEMKPTALVSGRVSVGMRQFSPLRTAVPSYRGPVASVGAMYIVRATRFQVNVARDVTYSFQADQPYYLLTDVGLAITQRLTYTWDVVARGSRQSLGYTAIRSAVPTTIDPQRDVIQQYGAGIGYRFGQTIRLGVDGSYFLRRSSNAALRDYEGLRVGASVTYGLPQ